MALRLLPIALPCAESFDAMRGDDQTRFCDSCGKDVHDLSARTEEEARALLTAARGTRICVRYARDASGAARFRAVAVAAAVSLAACTPHSTQQPVAVSAQSPAPGIDHDMGDMIPDAIDRCPDHPEANDDGCPEPAADGGVKHP
jgi:hypothetical protein